MTGITSNINEVVNKFALAAENAANIDFSEALLAGANAAMAKMKFRIFNEGKDANGIPFGIYIGKKQGGFSFKKGAPVKRLAGVQKSFTPYELKRLRRGRQVVFKDVEFEGDLRRAIVIIKETTKRIVCVIPNEFLSLVAKGQEEQIYKIRTRGGIGRIPIFQLSTDEKNVLVQTTNAVLKQIYARIIPIT